MTDYKLYLKKKKDWKFKLWDRLEWWGLSQSFGKKKKLYYYFFFRILYYYLEKKKKKKVHKLFYNFFYKLLLWEIIIDSYLNHSLISVWKRNSNLYFPLKIHKIIIILSLQVLPDKTYFFFSLSPFTSLLKWLHPNPRNCTLLTMHVGTKCRKKVPISKEENIVASQNCWWKKKKKIYVM